LLLCFLNENGSFFYLPSQISEGTLGEVKLKEKKGIEKEKKSTICIYLHFLCFETPMLSSGAASYVQKSHN